MTDGAAFVLACAVASTLFLVGELITKKRERHTMAGKRYGAGSANDLKLPEPMTFELEGLRYGDVEVHELTAVWRVDRMLALSYFSLPDSRQAEVLFILLTMIGKTLDNKDGVPVQWEMKPLPRPADAPDDWEPAFRGPDGQLHPLDQAEKFLDRNAGSSRRRWQALVDDGEFTVQVEQLGLLAKDLIAASGDRPTDG